VHGRKVEEAVAGSRAALNLAGVEVDQVRRGDVCVTTGAFKASSLIDARLQLLPRVEKTLANRTRIRFYAGTAEVIGRLTLLDRDQLPPGETGLVQFRLEEPVLVAKGDPFVVRLYSPLITLGGGTVLEPAARKHRRFQEEVIDGLRVREAGTPMDLLERAVYEAGESGANVSALATSLARSVEEVQADLAVLQEEGDVFRVSAQMVVHRERWESLRDRLLAALDAFHQANPMRQWMPREELRHRVVRSMPVGTFNLMLQRLQAEGAAEVQNEGVRRAGYRVRLSPQQEALAARLERRLSETPLTPPEASDLVAAEGPEAREVLNAMAELGRVVRITESLYLTADALEEVKRLVTGYIGAHGEMTAAEFRDLTRSSRRYAVPIMEYLDAIHFTRRVGDKRILW
ncbi:MAG: SelB C-terminal domain-containing protein, partial [Armatimonadota bacterium]|nr:SelB C-terminal domain-containing protein [Armatimonadota bacterium]